MSVSAYARGENALLASNTCRAVARRLPMRHEWPSRVGGAAKLGGASCIDGSTWLTLIRSQRSKRFLRFLDSFKLEIAICFRLWSGGDEIYAEWSGSTV